MRRSEAIKALGTVLLGGGAAAPHWLLEERQQSSAAGFTDVRTHGAKGDGVADDHASIQSAIEAVRTGGGGVVWFPRGRYKIGATVVVPVVLNETILLRGEGMRSAYLYPASKGMTAVRFGASTPDDSGISASKTQYCGMEDLSVSGSLLPPGTSVGVEFVEMQKGWMRNVIIEEFDKGASVGLHLRGARTTRGVGAAAPPHTWRCTFTNVVVPTTMRPLLIDNGDENDFFSCNFGLPRGLSAPPDSLAAVEITQGHNNRFFGLLVSGETDPRYRGAYLGVKFTAPVNGDNLGHQVYGLVAEGFNHGVWVDPAVRHLWIHAYNSSINAHAFWDGSDDGELDRERQNNVNIAMVSDNTMYHRTGRSHWPEPVTFPDGDQTPSVKGSDTYACSNSKPTTIRTFVDGRPGQVMLVRLDQNTRIAAGQGIRPAGNLDLVGAAHMVVGFAFIGGVWEQISQSRNS